MALKNWVVGNMANAEKHSKTHVWRHSGIGLSLIKYVLYVFIVFTNL